LKDKVRTFLRENENKAYLLMRAEMLGYLCLTLRRRKKSGSCAARLCRRKR
jgi:hypothetical protein